MVCTGLPHPDRKLSFCQVNLPTVMRFLILSPATPPPEAFHEWAVEGCSFSSAKCAAHHYSPFLLHLPFYYSLSL